MGILNHIHFYN